MSKIRIKDGETVRDCELLESDLASGSELKDVREAVIRLEKAMLEGKAAPVIPTPEPEAEPEISDLEKALTGEGL